MSGPGDSQDLGIAEGEGSPLAGPLQPQGRSLCCVVLGTEAFLGGGPWLLWLWTCQFSDISQEGSLPSQGAQPTVGGCVSVPFALALYSGQVSMEERCGPFPPLLCPWQITEPPSL